MTVIVKLITEQSTNQLEASVNREQANGWFPVCGVVCFNARYTQLVALDSNGTEVPKCNYFIVDSENGIDFARKVNNLLDLNPGAVCLSSVQYEQARYIQAYGDDTLHQSGGGGQGLKWYTQDAAGTYPVIDVNPNLSVIEMGNPDAGYVQLNFVTGGNNAGYFLMDDGMMSFIKSSSTGLMLTDNSMRLRVNSDDALDVNATRTILDGKNSRLSLANDLAMLTGSGGVLSMDKVAGIKLHTVDSPNIGMTMLGDEFAVSDINGMRLQLAYDRSVMTSPGGLSTLFLEAEGNTTLLGENVIINGSSNKSLVELDANAVSLKHDTTEIVLNDTGFNTLIGGMSVFNSDGEYTNLISGPSSLSLAPDFAGMSSVAGALELSQTRGIKLYTNGGVTSIIDANDTQATFGDLYKPTTVNGDSIILNGALGSGSIEIDANAVRIKRGSNNAFSISNSGGALTWNSMIRCAWNADGWNVSHDTGVAFSSRATYSIMQAKSGARVETNATGTTIISSDATASQSKWTLANSGLTVDTHGEYTYSIDGDLVFFSSGDITRINTATMGLEMDDGAGVNIASANGHPVVISGGPVLPSGSTQLGDAEHPWPRLYIDGSSQRIVQTSTASAAVPAATIAKMATLIPKALNTSGNDFGTGYTYEDVVVSFGADDALQYGLAWLEGTVKVVNPDAIQAMEALYRRSVQTREAAAESQERICGLVPGNGLNADHPLGDSGYAIRVTGKTNGDFDLYLVDSTPGRNVTYLYRKQTGTGVFEENSSQSTASTAALKLNTTDVNSTASVEVRLYISDITTGRGWTIRIWPQNRTNRRYNMSIFEMTEGDTPTYRDYSL
jgi:hypothetical protein